MTDMEKMTALLAEAESEFHEAAQHLRISQLHFKNGEVPRGCAHMVAARGHERKANLKLNDAEILHSSKARLEE
jgi:hypothetical protein